MTPARSSSNRVASVSEAVITQKMRSVGPLRLPDHRASDFIHHFNRVYRGLGLEIREIQEESKKIPGSPKAAGDMIDGSSSAIDKVT
ncbi:MAG: hypothetical protein ACR2NZ_04130 [Rubripirellula sp.]